MNIDNLKTKLSSPLPGSALSLTLCELAQHQSAPLIVVTSDTFTAYRLKDEINFFKAADIPVIVFPDWETLPYDNFSPHQEIISDRLRTLALLPFLNRGILIITINTLMQRLAPQSYLDAQCFNLTIGQEIELEKLKLRFSVAGYQNVAQVLAPGEFAVRGSLFDIFPMGSPLPYRIDLFDKEIESIRTFDPETQRTLDKIEKIDLLPAREFPLTAESITLFRQHWREQFSGNPTECPIYETISQGGNVSGIEYYFPLFFNNIATFFNYLPEKSVIVRFDNVTNAAELFWREIKDRFEQLRHDRTKPILSPDKLYLTVDEVFGGIKNFTHQVVTLNNWNGPELLIDHKSPSPLGKLKSFINEIATQPSAARNDNIPASPRILFCAESAGRREALLTLLHKENISPDMVSDWQSFVQGKQSIAITIAPLEQGAFITELNIILIPETLLFGQKVLQERRRKGKTTDVDLVVRSLAELTIGSPVVHIDHGVGRYLGLQTLTIGEQQGEFLALEYADNAKLYVPVTSLHLINRYSGVDVEHAPLHRLGSDQWEKAKRKAAEKINDVAAELLALHAQRAIREGVAHNIAEDNYALFANGFPFEETPDQQQAIADVIEDMRKKQGMDRLICGDVGFGKTEVAMRAAFVAVQSGYQVAVLVPTTLLAQQHYQNFCDRFADWPVKIDMLSRFKNAQEQQATLQQINDGKVDIIIGTHKLLQPDIHFKNLGLVIIDEEHRFGVQQKERLKKLRAEVDILTLTATPIPRTLNMAMSGMRDLSIIGTPPAKRLSVKTFVHQYNHSLVREALLREIMRGGQVFYLYNEVETIAKKMAQLSELVPEARIGMAHGQMRERELEQIMREFYHQHFNVLVCTTIIETGIDIPSANTIIIERADKFGLAQLHQLRGRVGRSHHQAYAYLLTPPHQTLKGDAQKRLDAISMLEDLGVGFALATHDLEIRGAGEILGEDQSGNIQEIGFSLYMELLERAVNSLKKGEAFDLEKSVGTNSEIDLQIPALIPDGYVPDVHSRLVLYKRIASAKTLNDLDELQVEFIDRFGLLPEPTKNLFKLTELKLTAVKMGIKKITGNNKSTRVEFIDKPSIDPMKIIHLIQKESHLFRLDGANKLKLMMEQASAKDRMGNLEMLFNKLN